MVYAPKKFSALPAATLPLTGTEDVVLIGAKTKVSGIRANMAANEAFRQGNIIGAVSQTGGIPDGALTTGWVTTANGIYKRDADGTQICIIEEKRTTTVGTLQVLYVAPEGTTIKTYPMPFAEIPAETLSISAAGSTAIIACSQANTAVATGKYYQYDQFSRTAREYLYRWMAVGRWFIAP